MENAEIVDALAEKVMGWTRVPDADGWFSPTAALKSAFTFNPLTNPADAMAVVERMRAEHGLVVCLVGFPEISTGRVWCACVRPLGGWSGDVWDSDWKRAICLASLRAVGVEA